MNIPSSTAWCIYFEFWGKKTALKSQDPAVESKEETGAPEEIEITPEMIEAGVGVLLAMDTRLEMYEDVDNSSAGD